MWVIDTEKHVLAQSRPVSIVPKIFARNIAFQSKADHLQTGCFCDLDLDPMTLLGQLDLDTMKIHLHTNKIAF